MTPVVAPWDVPGQVAQAINAWMLSVAQSALDVATNALQGMLTITPHFERIAEVQRLWNLTRGIADAFLILIALTAGVLLMVSSAVETRYTVKLVISRLLIAALLANLSLTLFSTAVDLNNALSTAFLGEGLGGQGLLRQVGERVAGSALQGPIFAIFALLAALLVLALVVIYVARLAILILALVASPMAVICYALPQTEGISLAWWRLTAATFLLQPVNALLLGVAGRVFFTADIGWGLDPTSFIIAPLVAIVVLYLLIQTPRWIYHHMIAPETYHRARSAIAGALAAAKLVARVAA